MLLAVGARWGLGEPNPVRPGRPEVTSDQVVVHGRAGSALAPPTRDRGRGELLVAAEPMHSVLGCDPARRVHLVSDEPVAERGVVRIRVDDAC